ncbi:MAG: hypothetical protein LBN34_01010 [Clostridiales Family XIII bacterium]|nr:hypothetical protein [Clostridiales Family XIII bacterium]
MINIEITTKYISDTLGLDVRISPWNEQGKLPYVLVDTYDLQVVNLEKAECLFIIPKGELGSLATIKKHLDILSERVHLPIVLILDSITPARKRSLIGAHIPFVVGKNQLYLPFMGAYLCERHSAWKPAKNELMPSAQAILFHCLYMKLPRIFVSDIQLGYSTMQISRSVKQLGDFGIVGLHKEGVRIVMTGLENYRAAVERAKPFLINPCKEKRIYVDKFVIEEKKDSGCGFLRAGLSALSEYSFLNMPALETIAYYGKVDDLVGTKELIDIDTQYEVEIWKYDPIRLEYSDSNNVVDPLSLVASLRGDTDDPRVEQAVEELLLKGQW